MRSVVVLTTVAILVVASLGAGYLLASNNQPPGTTHSASTSASHPVATSTPNTVSIQLHKVTFNETGLYCGGSGAYASEWAVTMDNITIVQPSNATLPFHDEKPSSPSYKAISTITFTVPDGVYYFNDTFGGIGGPIKRRRVGRCGPTPVHRRACLPLIQLSCLRYL